PSHPSSTLFPYTTLFRSDVPGQFSAMSQPPATAGRQTVALDRKLSPGQAAAAPVQVSCTSHTPAEPRHTVPDAVSVSAGQAFDADRKSTRLNSSHLGSSY